MSTATESHGIDLEDKMQELYESLVRWKDQKVSPDKELVQALLIMYELLGIFSNARLIAAAPTMLEAAVTEFLKHDGGPGSLDYSALKTYEARKSMIDAVLAATGETR